eukprot:759355-Hanusia_phi.AAC.3
MKERRMNIGGEARTLVEKGEETKIVFDMEQILGKGSYSTVLLATDRMKKVKNSEQWCLVCEGRKGEGGKRRSREGRKGEGGKRRSREGRKGEGGKRRSREGRKGEGGKRRSREGGEGEESKGGNDEKFYSL